MGFPFWLTSSAVETALRPLNLGIDYDTVERYNSVTRSIEKYTTTQRQFTQFKQGEGYYLKALKNTAFKVPAQDTGAKGPVELNEFVYDSSGNRVKKITSAGTTIYIGDLFERLPDGSTRKHIFAGSQRICTVTKGLSPAGTVPEVYYYHSDHLGSSNIITDKAGKQVQLDEYTPYGTISRQSTTSSVTSYLFSGKELDSSGLYYYGARYYHPNIAHFTQPDPIIQNIYDPQNLNHYSYCRNNPLNLIDPTGLSWSTTWNSWSSSISNIWNDWSTSISNTWNSISAFTQNTWQNIKTSSLDVGTNLYSFSQVTWNETKIWGSALGMGLNYGANIIIPPNTTLYKGLDLISNTLTQPGYNYGMWMYGDKSFGSFLGASLDAAWAISGISGAIKGVTSTPYWRYIGSESNSTYGPNGQVLNKTWLARGYQPPYNNMVIAKDKLQLPHMPTSVERVNVPFWRYVAGPEKALRNPQWGPGGGIEYRVGGWYDYK